MSVKPSAQPTLVRTQHLPPAADCNFRRSDAVFQGRFCPWAVAVGSGYEDRFPGFVGHAWARFLLLSSTSALPPRVRFTSVTCGNTFWRDWLAAEAATCSVEGSWAVSGPVPLFTRTYDVQVGRWERPGGPLPVTAGSGDAEACSVADSRPYDVRRLG